MSLLNRGKMEIKLGEYAIGQPNALTDPLLVARTQDYRRHVASRMVPLEPDQILKRFSTADYQVSLKVDGEFDMLVYSEGETLLVNPGGTVRIGLPLLKEAASLLKAAGVKKALIPGELHYTQGVGKRPRVHDVSRVARQPASQAELDGLSFAAFDLLEIDGKHVSEPYDQTLKRLRDLFKGGKHCVVVETVPLKDGSEILSQFNKWINAGAEGAVVRSEAVGTFKIKTRHTIDAVVIGFTEGTDDRRGMVHDLLLAVMRADGNLHVLGHVGGGFSVAERQGFLSDLKDMIVRSDYVEVNDQVAYHMVRPEWVVEISVLEFLSHTTRGLPIKTMVLNYNSSTLRYEVVRRLPMVALTSPQFIRRREDKRVNAVDIRAQQVSDIVEVPLIDRDSRQLNMPVSQILRREVFTKEMKGALMVRKLVMWQTNKEKESEDYPAFVIHYTDFSPNRKTPLEREVRVSSSRDQIDKLWDELASDNFTKGWILTAQSGPAAATSTPSPAAAASAAPALAAPEPPKAPTRKRKGAETAESAAPVAALTEKPPEPAVEESRTPTKKRASPKKKPE
jgi:hypothetical protein